MALHLPKSCCHPRLCRLRNRRVRRYESSNCEAVERSKLKAPYCYIAAYAKGFLRVGLDLKPSQVRH
eukprot:328924-Amphidinium_carterae.1